MSAPAEHLTLADEAKAMHDSLGPMVEQLATISANTGLLRFERALTKLISLRVELRNIWDPQEGQS